MFRIRRIAASRATFPPARCACFSLALLAAPLARSSAAGAESVDQAWHQFRSGQYTQCVAVARQAIADERYQEDWRLMLVESLQVLGRHAAARAVVTNALERYPSSLRLRLLAREVLLSNGETGTAEEMLRSIDQLIRTRPWAYRDAGSKLAFGRAALIFGADPRLVLDRLFEPVRQSDPDLREAHLATAALALNKHDYALAARVLREGLQHFPDDPDFHYSLARAYAPSERAHMMAALAAALATNTNHLPSLLLLVDHHIDAEAYATAEELLARVHAVNPGHPEAWAYAAVLAHLRNQPEIEEAARATALRHWPTNPQVDHLIGRKLSQKYRFAEGAAHQRQALEFDREYLPAKTQLAQDLLRLGEETEGWELAEAVHQRDGYDVAVFNLVTLRETMGTFSTVSNRHFSVRMHPQEAAVYGERVLTLLERARTQLSAKYRLDLESPTIVEIFPNPSDFGVRTFGMPHNPGFLGVCFGRVITANSPASQGRRPANWEAVLWHEFCHVVTLQLTRNKMPRWLSEGISVYEETQANPAWGQALTPRYREMILGGELTPIAELSGAFLSPPSELHLQFAYFQSALVVEFLVDRFGLDALRAVLHDLGRGHEINATLARHTDPLPLLEADFAAFARLRAEALAPHMDFAEPPLAELLANSDHALELWAATHPTNYHALQQQARQLMDTEAWEPAKKPLQRLIELYPGQTGPDNAYVLLAQAHRKLGETEAEQEVLARYARLSADATDAYLRLMELDHAAGNWTAVAKNAERYLAVNPLVAPPHEYLARAAEALGDTRRAIAACRTLLQLDPANPVELHFRLARLLHLSGDPGAKRHVLQALEDAPRFRQAHRLLLDIIAAELPAEPDT